MKNEKTFEEIIKSDCGQYFGGYEGDSACNTCENEQRCKLLTKDLDMDFDPSIATYLQNANN